MLFEKTQARPINGKATKELKCDALGSAQFNETNRGWMGGVGNRPVSVLSHA